MTQPQATLTSLVSDRYRIEVAQQGVQLICDPDQIFDLHDAAATLAEALETAESTKNISGSCHADLMASFRAAPSRKQHRLDCYHFVCQPIVFHLNRFYQKFRSWELFFGGHSIMLRAEMSRTPIRLMDPIFLKRRAWEGQIRWAKYCWQDVNDGADGKPVPLVVGDRRD